MSNPTVCTRCGSTAHTAPHCPWGKRRPLAAGIGMLLRRLVRAVPRLTEDERHAEARRLVRAGAPSSIAIDADEPPGTYRIVRGLATPAERALAEAVQPDPRRPGFEQTVLVEPER